LSQPANAEPYSGLPAPGSEPYIDKLTLQKIMPAAPGSMPYADFIQAIADKRVASVEFISPNGNEAYARISDSGEGKRCTDYNPNVQISDGYCKLQMGEGWPAELGNVQDGPAQVQEILNVEKVPYAWKYDFSSRSSKMFDFSKTGKVPETPVASTEGGGAKWQKWSSR
jgi:hypothetical protein